MREALGVFRYTRHAIQLVWDTNHRLLLVLAGLVFVAGLLPGAVAWVGQQIIDGVLGASQSGGGVDAHTALLWVAAEAGLVTVLTSTQRGIGVAEQLLRAELGFAVNVRILQKALTLTLPQFEDSEIYDKMVRARREASRRPLSLFRRTTGLLQNGVTLLTYGGLLIAFSPWAVVALVVAALPSFAAETRFSQEAFRLFSWRAPETRQQNYLEVILAREDYAKEVKLFGLGPMLLDRYRKIFVKVYAEDRSLTLRRGLWGAVLGLLSTGAFYGAYGWIAWSTIQGEITLGQMTMYLLVFKQGQSTIAATLTSIGGMYEDNLYLSNLYDFLDTPVPGSGEGARIGTMPGDGVRFEKVHFTYPGSVRPALVDLSLHVRPGEKLALVGENGSGKTTLVKLLSGFYAPDSGRVLVDGVDASEWDPEALRKRIGVIFQDFVKYQLLVGENVGVGDVAHIDDPSRWAAAADKGLAAPFIDELPAGYRTQLGRWFKDGRELSIGQWQKIALSRAFMRDEADILVLDEPTAAMDAEAEHQIFERFRTLTAEKMAILISHRFSTVRMADRIAVLHHGELVELGSHAELMAKKGRYERLFSLQAEGYR